MKKILITGITGQLGSYLAEKYLDKNMEVYGLIRRSSSFNTGRIDHIFNSLKLYYGDLTDSLLLDTVIHDIKPDYLINCAAQSHVAVSFNLPMYTSQVDALGTLSIMEAVKKHCPKCRVVQLSTSELYGRVLEIPQNENTPFNPVSPYAIAKQYAFHIIKYYREAYGIFASNAICFNMESERRGSTFVTKKITEALTKIFLGYQNNLTLGNLDAKRDWGYCPEYADGIIKIIEHNSPDDFVLATNETHTVREFIELCINNLNKFSSNTNNPIKLKWKGNGLNEIGINENTGEEIIKLDPKYLRPSEVDILIGDYSKAKKILKWEPKTKFEGIVLKMVTEDLKYISFNKLKDMKKELINIKEELQKKDDKSILDRIDKSILNIDTYEEKFTNIP